MGFSSERKVEGNKIKNSGYPVCRLTNPLTIEVDALATFDIWK